ncbi:MAG: 50S ribosomal protein L35 [Candidatus Omnitrophica bacterium]|nr:50S ribosomal protein L35 [Candidatus Omnitrophota bacterium]
MPKMKTKKAVAKRIRVTKNKKGMRSKGGTGHLMSSKSSKRKRQLKRKAVCSSADKALIKNALPYS